MALDVQHVVWHDGRRIGIAGKGWAQTAGDYDRLPPHAEDMTTPEVWELGKAPAGMYLDFETDATELWARWKLQVPAEPGPARTALAHGGLDLYSFHEGGWRWVTCTPPSDEALTTAQIRGDLVGGYRRYRLYLPYIQRVEKLEVGVPEQAAFQPVAPRADPPIAYYGTSIVHGHAAARPGAIHASMLARRLDMPLLNLGFAGVARMEADLARLFTELDPCLWVIDPVPNMTAALIDERATTFIKTLAEARPGVPIVMVGGRHFTNEAFLKGMREDSLARNAAFRKAFDALRADGVKPLYYVPPDRLLGNDGEATIDGSHPNELGYFRYAEALEPIFREALGRT